MNISGTFIWWVIGIALAWAALVVLQELAASDFWAIARGAFWMAS